MGLLDWLILIIPVVGVLGIGMYSRRYLTGVADFLAAGRVCGRYVISVGDLANALSILGLVAYVEVHYKTGFALAFWQHLTGPLGIVMSLLGFCTYRFRETKSLSLGQFLELRYNRSFRIFAAALRSFSEILANTIMPAIAARFFINFLNLPMHFYLFGIKCSTFMLVVLICLSLAIGIICMGGTMALIVTDAVQGMLCFPLIAIFIVFILSKFSWSNEILPVMMDRVPGESFLNPYDLENLRDFNLFLVVLGIFSAIFHRASWLGAGTSTAARSPHEQKMASLLGAWRNTVVTILYVLIAVTIITLLNHRAWSPEAKNVRDNISRRVAEELIEDEAQRVDFVRRIQDIPEQIQVIGVDEPLSQAKNLDTPVLEEAHAALKEYSGESQGNAKFQQFRTLFHQLMLGMSMRELLPPGLMGLFCLLMVLAMVSTDDTRIFRAAITITQDVIMPFIKKPLTPEQHITVLRLVSIGIGVFFFIGSSFMSQLDYISMFVTLMSTMWMGGCGPVMIFGLYSRFGTTAGAYASLGTGMVMGILGIFVRYKWAQLIYPWIDKMGWVDGLDKFLVMVSKPFNPYIVWKMDAVKFPINSYEYYFITMMITLFLYIVVSYLTLKEPFNLDRMLHRGIYNVEGENKERLKWSFGTVFSKLLGITKEYTLGDRFIAWSFFLYSFVYGFLIIFVGVIIWNAVSPWPIEWWGKYFLIVYMIVPGCVAAISTFWFCIGGLVDLKRLFKDLKARVADPLDNGRVEGNVSLADMAKFEEAERRQREAKTGVKCERHEDG
ncbi:MAG: sodium:panthothenate symporter [Oligosphaeraceae bacterium]|nr:sodium:panthothenate symporter [Oligosphaeraceae bacterium]